MKGLTPLVVRGSSPGTREWNWPGWLLTESGFLEADMISSSGLMIAGVVVGYTGKLRFVFGEGMR